MTDNDFFRRVGASSRTCTGGEPSSSNRSTALITAATNGTSVLLRPVRAVIRRLSWLLPTARYLLWPPNRSPRRVLAVWDFRTAPPTIGEMLCFQAKTLMLREETGVDKIDIAWLTDPVNPARHDPGTDSPDFHLRVARLLPLIHMNPHLGSFLLADSLETLTSYIADNADRYFVFPSPKRIFGRELYYTDLLNSTFRFYSSHGHVPYLACHPALSRWARQLICDRIRPKLPVVIQARLGADATDRNARLDEWLAFVLYCRTAHPDVHFIVIAARNEVDDRFRQCPNVTVSRDVCDTVEQDMALIEASLIYLGTTSGPNIMALVSGRPYLIYNFGTVHEALAPGSQLPYATPLQRVIWQPETSEALRTDFDELLGKVDIAAWERQFAELAQ